MNRTAYVTHVLSPEDRALAEKLVTEGWVQVSSKYRLVMRWKSPPPSAKQLLNPQWAGTYFGEQALRWLRNATDENALRVAPRDLVEERSLSPSEFQAFRELKSKPWREAVQRWRNAT